MNKDILDTRLQNQINVFRFDNRFTVDNDFITLNRYNFTSVFVYEVFRPRLQDTGCQLTPDDFLQIGLVYLYIFSQIEDFKNILIILETNRTQQRGYRQFLLTVDVSVHDIIDICSKLNP